jgi:hypothetical protein
VTPGSTLPVVSVTVPAMPWALATAGANRRDTITTLPTPKRLIIGNLLAGLMSELNSQIPVNSL